MAFCLSMGASPAISSLKSNNMSENYILVLCTCPSEDNANHLAHILVESGVAACCNIVPGLQSVFRWQHEIESSEEALLLIKSTGQAFSQLEHTLKAHHPYELPEIIAVPIVAGSPEYLGWINENVGQQQ